MAGPRSLWRAWKAKRQRRLQSPSDQMTLLEHLAELRTRIIKVALAVVIGSVLAFVFYPDLLHSFAHPYRHLCTTKNWDCPKNDNGFVIIDPIAGFATRLRVSTYGGIVIALPVILWQLWAFVAPGLHKHEKRYAIPFVSSSLLLFGGGAWVAYWTFPKALEFLVGYSGDVTPAFTPDKYISLLVVLMLAFGAAFEFPVFLVALELIGVLTPQRLSSWRRYAIVLIFVAAAVGTPSGDPYSMLGMAIPMCVFYEVAILIGRLIARRRRSREAGATA